MGQEIAHHEFTAQDFAAFAARLREETDLLRDWFGAGRFSRREHIGGFELETWLVDRHGDPAPVNEQFMARLHSDLVAPELAAFNVEFNTPPHPLHGAVLSRMQQDLERTWAQASTAADAMGIELAMIGILPTVREGQLCMSNMTPSNRYRALNQQVLRLRRGNPLRLDIQGRDHLYVEHYDVMLESAATSFQLHLQVHPERAGRYYNAAKILSAPMVAVCANSPYLFGRDLWDETRVPLFEQAVDVGGDIRDPSSPRRRVTFGAGYVEHSLLECFEQNLAHFEVLLPERLDEAPDRLAHLRLHNGTIWRWNRPLIGFDTDGTPHLRIEHRVAPAGPSIIDSIANAALFYGLAQFYASAEPAPETQLPFAVARANFYAAARHGLAAELTWMIGHPRSARELLLDELLAQAHSGLEALGLEPADIARYLGIVEARVRSGQNGAAWQRAYVASHGDDMRALTAAYLARQRSGEPVHAWDV